VAAWDCDENFWMLNVQCGNSQSKILLTSFWRRRIFFARKRAVSGTKAVLSGRARSQSGGGGRRLILQGWVAARGRSGVVGQGRAGLGRAISYSINRERLLTIPELAGAFASLKSES